MLTRCVQVYEGSGKFLFSLSIPIYHDHDFPDIVIWQGSHYRRGNNTVYRYYAASAVQASAITGFLEPERIPEGPDK